MRRSTGRLAVAWGVRSRRQRSPARRWRVTATATTVRPIRQRRIRRSSSRGRPARRRRRRHGRLAARCEAGQLDDALDALHDGRQRHRLRDLHRTGRNTEGAGRRLEALRQRPDRGADRGRTRRPGRHAHHRPGQQPSPRRTPRPRSRRSPRSRPSALRWSLGRLRSRLLATCCRSPSRVATPPSRNAGGGRSRRRRRGAARRRARHCVEGRRLHAAVHRLPGLGRRLDRARPDRGGGHAPAPRRAAQL